MLNTFSQVGSSIYDNKTHDMFIPNQLSLLHGLCYLTLDYALVILS